MRTFPERRRVVHPQKNRLDSYRLGVTYPVTVTCSLIRRARFVVEESLSGSRSRRNPGVVLESKNDDTDNMSWVTHSLCSHLVTFGAVCPTHGEVFNTRDMIPSMISKARARRILLLGLGPSKHAVQPAREALGSK